MHIKPFTLERYFAEYEFNVPYLLSASDAESLSMQELLDGADGASLALWHALKLGYTESQGHPLLRQEVAGLYERVGPDQVLVVAPEEGIFIAMHALLQAGDHAVVTFPGYQSLYEVAASLGCRVTRWTLHPVEGAWKLDLAQLEASITPQTRLLVVNFPHNPTGYLPGAAELNAIVDLARRHELYLFSDEMYWLLEYEPTRRLPAVCDLYERGISLFGLSKTFALPGLRIGWLATPDRELLGRLQAFKDYTTICSSAPSEVLAIMALRSKETIVARSREIIQRNLRLVDEFMDEHAEYFEWLRPRAGSLAFPRWCGQDGVEHFCREVREQKGVMIVPGNVFDFPGGHFRLGMGRRNLPQALARVGEYIRER